MSKWELPSNTELPPEGGILTPLLWIFRTLSVVTITSVTTGWIWVRISTTMSEEAAFLSWAVGFFVGLFLCLFGSEKARMATGIIAVVFTVGTVLICRHHIVDELVRLRVFQDPSFFDYEPEPEFLKYGLTAEQINARIAYRTYKDIAAERTALDLPDLFWIPLAGLTAYAIASRPRNESAAVETSEGT